MSNKRIRKRMRRTKQRQKRGLTHSNKQYEIGRKSTIHVRSLSSFERIINESQPVLVDFWAPWCGPCQAMSPVYEKVAVEFKDRVRFLKVNTEEIPELAATFNIRSIPTVIALDGEERVDRNVGLTSETTLTKMARRALDKSQRLSLSGRLKRLLKVGQEMPVEVS